MDETEARQILEEYVAEAEETFELYNVANEQEERKVIEAIKILLKKK